MAEPRAIGEAAPRRLIDDANHTHRFPDGQSRPAEDQLVVRTQNGNRLADDPEPAAGLDRPAHHGVCASGPTVIPTSDANSALEPSWASYPRLIVEPRSADLLVAQVSGRHGPLCARRANVEDRRPGGRLRHTRRQAPGRRAGTDGCGEEGDAPG